MPNQLDLRPYGINWILDPADPTSVYRENVPLLAVTLAADSFVIELPATVVAPVAGRGKRVGPGAAAAAAATSKTYTLAAALGIGGYGQTKPITDTATGDNTKCVKIIPKENTDRRDLISETIKQIIVVKASEHVAFPEINLSGPFAPRVFYVGEDATNYYIIMEQMRATLYEKQTHMLWPQDNELLYTFIAQTAKILDFLYKALQYNHRDLKTNNIMYIRDAAGAHVRLIDFGFSCLNYHGLNLGMSGKMFNNCTLEMRDMSFFIYFIYFSGFPTIPTGNMKDIARCLLDSWVYAPADWRKAYSFYNDAKYVNPNMVPDVIYNMFRDPEHWYSHLAVLNYTTVMILYNDPLFKLIDPRLVLDYVCGPMLRRDHTQEQLTALLERVIAATAPTGSGGSNSAATSAALQCLIDRFDAATHPMELAIRARLDCVALFPMLMKLPKVKVDNAVYLIYAIKYRRLDHLKLILERNSSAAFVNQRYEDRTPLMWSCSGSSSSSSSSDTSIFYTLLAVPTIDLKALDKGYHNIIHAIIEIDNADLRLELLEAVLTKDSTTDFVNNRAGVAVGPQTPLEYAFALKPPRIETIDRLLECPGIDLQFAGQSYLQHNALSACVRMKPGASANYLFDKVLAIASEPSRLHSVWGITMTRALLDCIREGYIPWLTKLLKSPLVLPNDVLHNMDKAGPEVVDLVLGRAGTPLYVNALNFDGKTPLMSSLINTNYYFAKKLLGFPFVKTAIQDQKGKTALHYAAIESAAHERSHSDGGEAFEIVKLLVERNPLLPGLRNYSKKGPSNPNYVRANSATRKYIKARKFRFMTPRNTNRNIKE
jgi:serine/threonine protein kinase